MSTMPSVLFLLHKGAFFKWCSQSCGLNRQRDFLKMGAEGLDNQNRGTGSLLRALETNPQRSSLYLLTWALTISKTAVRMDFWSSLSTSVENIGGDVPA